MTYDFTNLETTLDELFSKKKTDLVEIQRNLRLYKDKIDTTQLDVTKTNNNELKSDLRDRKRNYKEFMRRFHVKENVTIKKELLEDEDVENKIETNENLMKHGDEVLKHSKTSLENTLRTINDAKIIGIDTNKKLDDSNERIIKINDDVEQTETVLNRSTKIISRIGRRLASDKYIQCMMVLVLIGIILLILASYGVLKK